MRAILAILLLAIVHPLLSLCASCQPPTEVCIDMQLVDTCSPTPSLPTDSCHPTTPPDESPTDSSDLCCCPVELPTRSIPPTPAPTERSNPKPLELGLPPSYPIATAPPAITHPVRDPIPHARPLVRSAARAMTGIWVI
ncbi:MAG: hypothetical protein IT435_09180 [Phycisphaerales bacterium]|nr:hypothetical protein [Phycisphaerales bacterium]